MLFNFRIFNSGVFQKNNSNQANEFDSDSKDVSDLRNVYAHNPMIGYLNVNSVRPILDAVLKQGVLKISIPEFLDAGRWTLIAGSWTLNPGRWTLDARRWTLDFGRSTLDTGRHVVRLTIWHQVFLEFWLVDTLLFARPRDQRAVTRLENVRQLNKRRRKKLGFQLSHRQPHAGRWTKNAGLWTLYCGCWTLRAGLWTPDTGHWTLYPGLWTLDPGCWTLDSGCWTLDTGLWPLDSRLWKLDSGH